jgi:hypothetical protein
MKGMKLVKHMKGFGPDRWRIRRVRNRNFMTFIVFMSFTHGGSHG